MSGTIVTLQHDQQYYIGSSSSPLQGKALLNAVINELTGVVSGAKSCSAFQVAANGANPLPAAAIFDVGTAGTQTLTIGGVDFAVAFTTSAAVTGGLMVTAVNASSNTLINKVVQASQIGATCTMTSVVAGSKCVILGVALTCVASNPTNNFNNFVVGAADLDTAETFAACVNAHPVLSRYIKATPVAEVVYLMCLTAAFPTGPTAPPNRLLDLGTTLVMSAATLAAIGFVQVSSFRRDVIANHITVAAAGTGASMLNTQTRLVGGAGGQVTSLLAYP